MINNIVKYSLFIIIVLLGLYYYLNKNCKSCEGFHRRGDRKAKRNCPDTLIQKGNEYYLYNSRLAKVPGVNPVKFRSLSEYEEFIEWQRSQGIKCPILFLEEVYDTQGNPIYKERSGIHHSEGGNMDLTYVKKLKDASRDDPPYNMNSYPGMDQQNQNIGVKTPLDKIYQSQENAIQAGLITKFDPNIFDPRL